jgi:hypothetical protein
MPKGGAIAAQGAGSEQNPFISSRISLLSICLSMIVSQGWFPPLRNML